LTFIQLPDELLDKLAKEFDMQRGYLPKGLLRGQTLALTALFV
jgi:hypothetical protein